jgi:hypothetical protein
MLAVYSESLNKFSSAADRFFKEELQLDVSEEVIRNIFLYHLDSFSTAYTRHRNNPCESTRQAIIKIISVASKESFL